MEGRIWVSAIHTIRVELEAAGLASRDEFGAAWLTALALVRHIPREHGELFADSARVLADELRLSFGPDAGDIADAVLGERGLLACEHVLDLHDEVALPLGGDDPLDARFMVFTSYRTHIEAETVAAHPYAPPLQHVVTLGPDEGGVRLRARPTLWRPARPVEVGELDFTLGLLVNPGDGGVPFSRDPETKLTVNDAALRFESAGIDAEGWVTVEATGLTPGETYSLALVSLSPVDGDKYVIEHMRWELLAPAPAPDPAPETTGALETDGDTEGGTDSGEGLSDGGCGCAAGDARGGAWWWLLTLGLLPARRRATPRVSSRRGASLD